jgi:hypothetical protein
LIFGVSAKIKKYINLCVLCVLCVFAVNKRNVETESVRVETEDEIGLRTEIQG